MSWTLLILSLPSQANTARMRAWRALKAGGAAVLRDGVYLLPASPTAQALFESVAADVQAHDGQAHLLHTEAPDEHFAPWFDRSQDWQALLAELDTLRGALQAGAPADPDAERLAHPVEAQRQWRRLAKAADTLTAIDFFPGAAQRQALAASAELERALQALLQPSEPQPVQAEVPRLDVADHQGRVWATRARPWVDRLASAWLIRRFIDPQATILWLAHPADCPPGALGFDFDGATFSHVGERVSFETLLAAFGLDDPALRRVGRVVHALDVGGAMPPEAAGLARVLAGLREALTDDDQLLQIAAGVFEGLWIGFDKELPP